VEEGEDGEFCEAEVSGEGGWFDRVLCGEGVFGLGTR
jgi:hypothetical protein